MSHMKRHHLWVDHSCCCVSELAKCPQPVHFLVTSSAISLKTWLSIRFYVVDYDTWKIKKNLLHHLHFQRKWHNMCNVGSAMRKLREPYFKLLFHICRQMLDKTLKGSIGSYMPGYTESLVSEKRNKWS